MQCPNCVCFDSNQHALSYKELPFAKTIFGLCQLNKGVISTVPIPAQWSLDYKKVAMPPQLQPKLSFTKSDGNTVHIGPSQPPTKRITKSNSGYFSPQLSLSELSAKHDDSYDTTSSSSEIRHIYPPHELNPVQKIQAFNDWQINLLGCV